MGENLSTGVPIFRINNKAFIDQILGIIGNVIPIRRWKVVVAPFYDFKQLRSVLLVKGGETAQQNVKNYPQGPDINLLPINSSTQYFWGNVPWSAACSV